MRLFFKTQLLGTPVHIAEQLFKFSGLTALNVVFKPEKEGPTMETFIDFPQVYEFKLRPDWPVDIGIATGTILGYVFACIGLVCILYLEHWMAGMVGALAGGFAGWIWYRLVKKKGAKPNAAG